MNSVRKLVQAFLITLIILVHECRTKPRLSLPQGAIAGPYILRKPDPPVLYKGDNVTEFLNLCPAGCDVTNGTPACPLLELNNGECDEDDLKVIQSLRYAQTMVRDYHTQLQDRTWDIVLWTWYGIILCMGLYLIIVKHFHCKTLWDWRYPDPTQGMNLWQYERLKYVAAEVQHDPSKPPNTTSGTNTNDAKAGKTKQKEPESSKKTMTKEQGKALEKTFQDDNDGNVNSTTNETDQKLPPGIFRTHANESIKKRKQEIHKQIQLNNEAKRFQSEQTQNQRLAKYKTQKQRRNQQNDSKLLTLPKPQQREHISSATSNNPESKNDKEEKEAKILYPKTLQYLKDTKND